MIRLFATAFTWMVVFILAMTACVPVQLVPESSSESEQGQPGTLGSGTYNNCSAVASQAIAYGRDVSVQQLSNALATTGVEVIASFQVQGPVIAEIDVPPYDVFLLQASNFGGTFMEIIQGMELSLTANYYVTQIEGAGHSPSQSPFGAMTSIPKDRATPDAFFNQWALHQITSTQLYSTYHANSGQGVTIAVFDSQPYSITVPPFSKTAEIIPQDVLATMPITIHHADILGPGRDHGLFVASLAHAVAPSSTLKIYRVLNENGEGDMFTLAQQLNQFHQIDFAQQPTATQRAVVNMSLSTLCEDSAATTALAEDVKFLKQTLNNMYQDGIVLVAAAGNYGNVDVTPSPVTGPTTRPAAAFPASLDEVIGVGATDKQYQATCYSNQANIFAPGGAAVYQSEQCLPAHYSCLITASNIGDCEYGLVGLATAPQSGLAYWSGTSFAAPLVSGLMALVLSAPGDLLDTHTNIVDVGAIHDMLYKQIDPQYGQSMEYPEDPNAEYYTIK